MGCRCSDIGCCENDISKISNIKSLFSNTESTNFSVTMELQNLANNCLSTFFSANMLELMAEEKKLNKDMIELLPKLVDKCEYKIKDLNEELDSMRSEDYDYHHRDDDDDDDDD